MGRQRPILEFVHGGIYRYEAVPEAMFYELVAAESAGKYFSAKIKKDFAYSILTSPLHGWGLTKSGAGIETLQ